MDATFSHIKVTIKCNTMQFFNVDFHLSKDQIIVLDYIHGAHNCFAYKLNCIISKSKSFILWMFRLWQHIIKWNLLMFRGLWKILFLSDFTDLEYWWKLRASLIYYVFCICQKIDHPNRATLIFSSPWRSVEELTCFNTNQCFEWKYRNNT